VRDLTLPALWVAGWTGNTFVWRGNAMNMGNGELADAPAMPDVPSLADRALALRLRSRRVVRQFRTLGAFNALGERRRTPSKWTWKTGNKPR
jgi:hypothetical protein